MMMMMIGKILGFLFLGFLFCFVFFRSVCSLYSDTFLQWICVGATCSSGDGCSRDSSRCQYLYEINVGEIHRGPIGVSLPSPQGGGSQLSPPSPSSHHPIFLSNGLTELLLLSFPPLCVCVCVFTRVGIRFLRQIQDTEVDSQMFPPHTSPGSRQDIYFFWFLASYVKASMNEMSFSQTWQQSTTCYIKMLWSDGVLTSVRVYIRASLLFALVVGAGFAFPWCVSKWHVCCQWRPAGDSTIANFVCLFLKCCNR